jgi:DNA-binding NtrC family response regulator
VTLDVRIIAATSRDLEDMARSGTFRQSLFYSLNEFPIHIPPLRNRKDGDDILTLAGHFLQLYGKKRGTKLNFSQEALDLLTAYDYPGNVRELENAIKRAVLLAKGNEILPEHLPSQIHDFAQGRPPEVEKKDFFVSHNSADKGWAEWIAWQLEETGYTTVIQAWDFRPGGNFVLQMQRAAEQARHTIAVLSPNYLSSLYTQPEWAFAFAQDPTGEKGVLLPVRVSECELKGLLSQIVYVDLVGLTEEAARETLVASVKRGRAKPTAAPGFPETVEHVASVQPSFPGESSEP